MTRHRWMIGIACTLMLSMIWLGETAVAAPKSKCLTKAAPLCPVSAPATCVKKNQCGGCVQWRCGQIKFKHQKLSSRRIPA